MFQEESGPWNIFERLRAKVWPLENNPGSFREGFFCFMCMSVWIGILLALLLWLAPVLFYLIAVPAALSTGAIFINDWRDRNDQ